MENISWRDIIIGCRSDLGSKNIFEVKGSSYIFKCRRVGNGLGTHTQMHVNVVVKDLYVHSDVATKRIPVNEFIQISGVGIADTKGRIEHTSGSNGRNSG